MINAKQRLLADNAAFIGMLVENLNSMTPPQCKSLTKALLGVQAWFNGDAMSRADRSRVDIKAAPLNLNLTANGMAWLSKVFGLGKPPESTLYRMHDMIYPYAEAIRESPNKLIQLTFGYRDDDSNKVTAKKVREHFPKGSTVVVTNNKALVSFSTSLRSVKRLGWQAREDGFYLTDAYLQAPSASMRTLLVTEKVPEATRVAATLLRAKGLNRDAKSVAHSIYKTLYRISEFASQREVVCLLGENHKFKAQILGYAR